MPKYTVNDKERDIYGELGWTTNFSQKHSKDNDKMYPTAREFFDSPRHYASRFANQDMTNAEFFRENAPRKSVARLTRPPKM